MVQFGRLCVGGSPLVAILTLATQIQLITGSNSTRSGGIANQFKEHPIRSGVITAVILALSGGASYVIWNTWKDSDDKAKKGPFPHNRPQGRPVIRLTTASSNSFKTVAFWVVGVIFLVIAVVMLYCCFCQDFEEDDDAEGQSEEEAAKAKQPSKSQRSGTKPGGGSQVALPKATSRVQSSPSSAQTSNKAG